MRGQYDGYHDVDGVDAGLDDRDATSRSGSAVDSWRWAGVPIVIRAGKCMPVTATEVTVPVPAARRTTSFGLEPDAPAGNQLRFRIWPESEVGLTLVGQEARRRLGPAGGGPRVRRSTPGRTCAPTTG